MWLWNFSLMIGVKERWLIMSAIALVGLAWCIIREQKNKKHAALGHLAFLTYVLILLIFVATESPAFYTHKMVLRPVFKKLLLAGDTGILVQLAIWFNRLTRAGDSRHRILGIYLDVAMGFLTALVGAVAYASVKDSFTFVADEQVVIGGAIGGALGVKLFDLLTFKFAPSGRDSSGAPTAAATGKHVTCLYAGQTYSAGSTLAMPNGNNAPVVKICHARSGQWVEIEVEKEPDHHRSESELRHALNTLPREGV